MAADIDQKPDDPYRGRNYPYNEPPEKFKLLEDKIIRQILLPGSVFMQPSPKRNPGGDCFACMTTAVFKAMFPDKDITFDNAFESWFVGRNQDDEKVLSNVYHSTPKAMHEMAEKSGVEIQLYAYGGFARYADPKEYSGAHWTSAYAKDMEIIEAFLSAGWYLLYEISADPKIPINPDGSLNSHDHFVVVNGYRKRYNWSETKYSDDKWMKSGGWQEYFHVWCSKYGAYWIDDQTFTRLHGAANFWCIRAMVEGDHS